jgi:hypothetical protein
MEPLLEAANAPVASTKASPSSKPLENFANFISSFFFPENVGNRFWAAWSHSHEKLAFSDRESLTMLQRG